MTLNNKYLFWIVLAVISIFFLVSVKEVLSPFIISILIAYLLDPMTNKLESYGVKRYLTVLIIVTLFFLLLFVSIYKVAPLLLDQIQQFIHNIPEYESFVINNFSDIRKMFPNLNDKIALKINEQFSALTNQTFQYATLVIKGVFNSSIAILNIFALIFFTPILVFYILRDWPSLESNLKKLAPVKYKAILFEQLKQIDLVVSSYIRGQLIICFFLSLFYAIALSAAGLKYHLLIAVISGIITIIPFFGIIVGAIICLIVSYLQSSSVEYTSLILGIFTFGHIVEAYIVFPKLIGDKVGLHPVWVLFALLAGGALFGFWGLFFAVPIAAIIGIVFKSVISVYYSSKIYTH